MDNKQIEKINIIKSYLPKCISIYGAHVYGNIPKDKFLNACNSYAGKVGYNETIGLIDETVFGSGKKGFLFTFDGYYYDGCGSIKLYKNNTKFNGLGSSYNLAMMNEMLQKLYEVEVRKSKLENFLDTTLEIGQAILENIDDVDNIIEYVADELSGDAYAFKFSETEDLKENLQQISDNIRKANDFLEKMDKAAERAKEVLGKQNEDAAIGVFFVYLEKADSGLAEEIDEMFELLITNMELELDYEVKFADIIDEVKEAFDNLEVSQIALAKIAITAFIANLKLIKLKGSVLSQCVDTLIENV